MRARAAIRQTAGMGSELPVAAIRWFVNLCKSALCEATFWSLERLGIDLGATGFGGGGGGGDAG